MSQSTVGIDVKARADFSDVERAAAKAARTVSAQFQTAAPAPRAASGFGRIFKDAARDVGDLERRLESLKRSASGLNLLDRVRRSGQDPNRPGSWNWDRLGYGQGTARDAIRRRFEAGWDRTPVAAAGPSIWRERAAGAGQVAGAAAAQSAAGFATGLTGFRMPGGLGGTALIGVAAMGALAAGAAVKRGYEEHLRVIEDVDGAFKSMRSTLSFDGLVESVRGLATALDLTSDEGARLAATYQKQSGALDAGMVGRAEAAGAFGRGLGLDPNVSAGFMARAELLGVGGNKAQQRELAATLAHGIAQSGMSGRAEQYLEQMVGQIENLAQSQARAMSTGEIGRYNELMGGLLMNPALRGGGAQTIYGALKAEGGPGGMLQEALQWQIFGAAAGNDRGLVKLYSELEPHQSPFDVLGYGPKTTRLELQDAWAKQYAAQYGGDPLMAEALAMSDTYSTPIAVTIAKRRQMNALKDSGIDYGAFSKWAASQLPGGITLDDIDQSGFGNLTKLYAGRNDTSAEHTQWLRQLGKEYANDANISDGMRGKLNEAINANDINALRRLLPEVAAYAGQQRTDADRMREANSDLSVGLERLGSEAFEAAIATKKMQEALTNAAQWVTNNIKGVASEIPQTFDETVDALSRSGKAWAESVVSSVTKGISEKAGIGEPRSWRNFNPGNIEGQHFGAIGNDGRFAVYATPEAGWSAMEKQLKRYYDGKTTGTPLRTVRDILSTWSPKSDPTNPVGSTHAYILAVSKRLGIKPDDTIDWNNRAQIEGLMSAMASHEAGKNTPYGSKMGSDKAKAPETPKDKLSPALEAGAPELPKYHTGGLVRPIVGLGSEVPAVLRVGEEVLTERDPRHRKNLPPATAGRMSPEHAINARWQGALEMNVVFRDARGNVVQQRNALAVSEPRIPGSGPAQRWTWTDSVLMPS